MNSLSQHRNHLTKTSIGFAALLGTLYLGLGTLSVNAQTPTNGIGEFKKRLQEQLANSNRSQLAEETTAVAEPTSDSALEPQEESLEGRLEPQKKALAGSWLRDHTITSPPELAGISLKTLAAFTEDGRAFETGQGDIIPPVFSPGFGSWEHQGGGTFAISFIVITYDTAGGMPPGTFLGLAKISETVTLDRSGNKCNGSSKAEQFDVAGNLVFSAETTFTGTRIKVEPLQ
jgi:hypothetical protein